MSGLDISTYSITHYSHFFDHIRDELVFWEKTDELKLKHPKIHNYTKAGEISVSKKNLPQKAALQFLHFILTGCTPEN